MTKLAEGTKPKKNIVKKKKIKNAGDAVIKTNGIKKKLKKKKHPGTLEGCENGSVQKKKTKKIKKNEDAAETLDQQEDQVMDFEEEEEQAENFVEEEKAEEDDLEEDQGADEETKEEKKKGGGTQPNGKTAL